MTRKSSFDVAPSRGPRDRQLWRDLVAFWFLGLCNNYGYVVMLSAAHDIIARFDTSKHDVDEVSANDRQCHILSTGAILIADIFPSLFVKFLMPFIPLWVNIRVFIAVAFSYTGFIMVGFATATWMAILGVVITSASRGIGEATFLSYSSKFNRNVISTWSSGTGAAGVIGSLSYAALSSFDLTTRKIMLIMLIIPTIEAIAFWIVLRNPKDVKIAEGHESSELVYSNDEKPLKTFKERMLYMKNLCKYMWPLAIVYFFEYFINQGLFELVHFKNTFLQKTAQYRWFNVTYQVGVFISRSSVNLLHIPKIWILSILQFLNVMYFLTETLYYYTPTIWITFCIILWEGLLGGAAYVNTFYRMSQEVPPAHREFAMAMVVLTDALGVTLAGFVAMPIHNAICGLPAPERAVSW